MVFPLFGEVVYDRLSLIFPFKVHEMCHHVKKDSYAIVATEFCCDQYHWEGSWGGIRA